MADSQLIQDALAKYQESVAPAPMSPAPEPAPQPEVVAEPPLPAEMQVPAVPVPATMPPAVEPQMDLQQLAAAPAPLALPVEQQQQVVNAITPQSVPILSQEALQKIAEPTPEQVAQETDAALQPYRVAKAQALAMDGLERMRRDAEDRQQARERDLEERVKEIDSKVRDQSFSDIFRDGSTGQKMLAAFSILLGGISQGMTGARSNPAIDFMNQVVEQQAQKDRLNQAEKEALRKQVYEAGLLEMKKLEDATNSAYRKDTLRLQQQELQQRIEQANAKLQAEAQAAKGLDMFTGRALTKEEILKVRSDKNLSRNLVTMPNGKAFLANNPSDAIKFKEFARDSVNALTGLEEYKKLAENGSKISLSDLAKSATLQQAIVGGLRLPLTGPGVLTDTERAQLLEAIGNPLSPFRLKSIEIKKIEQLMDALKANTVNTARLSGVTGDIFDDTKFYKVKDSKGEERIYKESGLIEEYKKRLPNLSEDQIRRAIQTSIPQL